MIVGACFLFPQVIGFGILVDVVAAMQSLPEGRRKLVRDCIPQHGAPGRNQSRSLFAYIGSDQNRFFFSLQLTNFLRGNIMCRNAEGSGLSRESLLKEVPTYELAVEHDTALAPI